eukprot:8799593-Alexandrium_andersonii.AAC.1
MVACLAEGIRALGRKCIGQAVSTAIHQDSRKGELGAQFVFSTVDLKVRQGSLGCVEHAQFDSGASAICLATKALIS